MKSSAELPRSANSVTTTVRRSKKSSLSPCRRLASIEEAVEEAIQQALSREAIAEQMSVNTPSDLGVQTSTVPLPRDSVPTSGVWQRRSDYLLLPLRASGQGLAVSIDET